MQGVGRLTTLSAPSSQRVLTQARVLTVGGLKGRIPVAGSGDAVGCWGNPVGVSMACSLVGPASTHTAQCSV